MKFDHHILRMDVERKMRSEHKGPKSIVKEIGVARDTYFHILRGHYPPKMGTFIKFLTWLGTDPNRYFSKEYATDGLTINKD